MHFASGLVVYLPESDGVMKVSAVQFHVDARIAI